MKKRMGFVSNSSSSSFLCVCCGEIESGYDLSMGDAGFCECSTGHVFCEGHKLKKEEKEKEEETEAKTPCGEGDDDCDCECGCDCHGNDEDEDEDEDEDDYYTNVKECPICQLKTLTEKDGFSYLKKLHNVTDALLLEKITASFSSYEDFKKYLKCPVYEKEKEEKENKEKKESLLGKMDEAVELVRSGKVKRIDVDDYASVYKVGAVTRIDIKG